MGWADSFESFCSHLVIDSKESGTVPLRLNGCQRYFVQEVAEGLERGIRYFVVLKGRQLGISTITLALDLFWCFRWPGLQGALITDTDSNKEMFREMLARYYDGLPREMKAKLKLHNRNQMVFRNRSTLQYLVAGVRASGNLGRAKALNHLHATECSSWADEEGLASLQSSLAEKSPNRLYVFESTARGFNLFYDMCQTAKRAITQKFIFIPWWRKEEYSFPEDSPEFHVYCPKGGVPSGREREWIEKVARYYDYRISASQLAWYRWHLAEKKNADEMWMMQEYPSTEEQAFVVAGSQFFSSSRLTEVYFQCRRAKYDSYRYNLGSEFRYTKIVPVNRMVAELKVWEEPQSDARYVLGADPAYGSSDWADRFAIVIFRCFADRIIQVAEYCSSEISTYQFAWIIAHLAGAYRPSLVNLEVSGPGGAVVTELINLQRLANTLEGSGSGLTDVLGSIRHYFWMRPDASFSGPSRALHWKTNEDNKFFMLSSFKDSFELGRMQIQSTELIEEMRNVVNDKGKIAAAGRSKDDRVIAAALAHIAWLQYDMPVLAQARMTYAAAQRRAHSAPQMDALRRSVVEYLKRMNIA